MDLNPRLSLGEEVILPFPAARHRITPVTQLRSTWVASSLQALRERGLYERYVDAIDPAHRDAIATCVAGTWLPIAVGMAHYEACDRLDLAPREQMAIGAQVMRHTQRSVLTLALRLAMRAGASPWDVFAQHARRLWERTCLGGGVGVFKIGPRQARVEFVGWPCARLAYCRAGMKGMLLGFAELFCDKTYVHELTAMHTPTSVAFRLIWV